ncbi:MAG: hypothetical protein HOP11_11300, partial [Saprospiraceae bacterium]|nr:hypothetical protein [Saprospiraceae bacterium]
GLPCNYPSSSISFGSFTSSSGDVGVFSNLNDGIISNESNYQTNPGIQSYIQFSLINKADIDGVQIFPINSNSIFLQNYYIFSSDDPLNDKSFYELLNDGNVLKVHVNYPTQSGDYFSINRSGQYIRIQSNSDNIISINEIIVKGRIEICNDGIDNDCDDLIDCADPSCKPKLTITYKSEPSCYTCNDGILCIRYGNLEQISIDKGANWTNVINGQIKCFENLSQGDYSIVGRHLGHSGCLPDTLRVSLIPVLRSDSCCVNGDFRDGNFKNWNGSIWRNRGTPNSNGSVTLLPPQLLYDGIDTLNNYWPAPRDLPENKRFKVINTNDYTYNDYRIGNIINVLDNITDKNVARIGGPGPGGYMERIQFCFKVKECNSNFHFKFLPVFQESIAPVHLSSEQPYFFMKLVDNTTNSIIDSFRITADSSDPKQTIISYPNTRIHFSDWDCYAKDLSGLIGHEVCVMFEVRDCAYTEHYGYAYLAGLCTGDENYQPILNISRIKETYCKADLDILDFTNSKNYNRFEIQVCKNSQNPDQCTPNVSKFGRLEAFNLKDFLQSHSISPECNYDYEVKIKLFNSCGFEASNNILIHYLCDSSIILNYQDYLLCDNNQDILINGTISNCNNCDITWQPSQYIEDNKVAEPKILGATDSNAFNRVYIINAEGSNGCTATDSINIIYFGLDSISASIKNLTFCNWGLEILLHSGFKISSSRFNVKVKDLQTGIDYFPLISSDSENSNKLIYLLYNLPDSILLNHNFEVTINSLGQNNCPEFKKIVVKKGLYYHDGFRIGMPNEFHPGDTVNNTFGPVVPLSGYNENLYKYGHNGITGTLKVYRRWNMSTPFFSKTVTGTSSQPFNIYDLHWDGKINGDWAPQDTYIYE